MAFSLQKQDVERIDRILLDLLERCEADDCLVCDEAGHVMASQGASGRDPLLISALGAGVFAGTRELARLLGEDEFSAVLHQGTRRSLLMSAVSDDALVVVLFSAEANLGLVKLYVPTAAASVRSVLEEIRSRGEDTASEDHTFVLRDDGDMFGLKT